MKKLINNWLEKLARANEESFGSGPLDCCGLNEDSKVRKSNNKTATNNKDLKNKKN